MGQFADNERVNSLSRLFRAGFIKASEVAVNTPHGMVSCFIKNNQCVDDIAASDNWVVFIDSNLSQTHDSFEQTIWRISLNLNDKTTIEYRGFKNHPTIQWSTFGNVDNNGRLTICSGTICKTLILNRVGRVRLLTD